jgi:hypothetical protein
LDRIFEFIPQEKYYLETNRKHLLEDEHPCCIAAPDEDENTYPGIVSPFRKGGKGDLIFYCSVIARNEVTWQSHS